MPNDTRHVELIHTRQTPDTLARQLAHTLDIPTGDVTIELVYRNQQLARLHIHEHRTYTRRDLGAA